MSIFNELLPKFKAISESYTKNFNNDLKEIFECFDKFEEEYLNGRCSAREKSQKEKTPLTTLQRISEDDDNTNKAPEPEVRTRRSRKSSTNVPLEETRGSSGSSDSNSDKRRHSNKRTKNEVDGIVSPEQDKRQKRNASVKAQTIISKQVNVNLTQKMRREDLSDKQRSRRHKDDDKENQPEPVLQIKLEKVSLPPEPMDFESAIDIELKQEPDKDEIAMPPPTAPVPKPRKGVPKAKSEDNEEESSGRSRSTRTRKQTDSMPPPPDPEPRKAVAKGKSEDSEEESSGRSRSTRTRKQTDSMPPPPDSVGKTRRSVRASSRTKPVETEEPLPEARPKRTRAKKKASEATVVEIDKDSTQTSQINGAASPIEKPRPKRTRRAHKAAEKLESQKSEDSATEQVISLKEERTSQPEISQSPILQKEVKTKAKETKSKIPISGKKDIEEKTTSHDKKKDVIDEGMKSNVILDETRVLEGNKLDPRVSLDRTIVLPNGVYNHAPVTPQNVRNVNEETIILEKGEKDQKVAMDATVVLYKDQKTTNISEDNSLLTDDNSDLQEHTPPKQQPPSLQPTSAVKEKVQQFEEMASRVTRTKTRAMAKKVDDVENQTPPDKMSKPVLSAETLAKMNNLIFNGKTPQISSSASKPHVNMPALSKLQVSASTSKLNGISKAKEAAEERTKREREDARKKKEAILEAKREQQRRKREEKMAAAAAVREAAEKERRLAMEMAAKERMEKQAHADQGKLERMKEAERKKMELARKVAETEERRRAEEQARQQRLAEEQRRADAGRKKQIEEAEAMKKEAALMAKEMEKKRREYEEKQKKSKAQTPLKLLGTPGRQYHMEPVYMCDGFQYLNSDEEDDSTEFPVPAWSVSRARKSQLLIQSQISEAHVDKWFSVRVHSPDLREIFPNIERSKLKRTSSAVWNTPQRLPAVNE